MAHIDKRKTAVCRPHHHSLSEKRSSAPLQELAEDMIDVVLVYLK
jgi:hypothetical protein